VLLLAGCSPPKLAPTTADLSLAPTSLEWGEQFLGAGAARTLTLTNTGRAVLDVELEVSAGPFAMAVTSLTLAGATSEVVTLTLDAPMPGAVEGALEVTVAAGRVTVPLRGTVLPLPVCPVEPCASWTFSYPEGRCVRRVFADDTACVSGCDAPGRCVAGSCLADGASVCDDDDGCTLDACGNDGGCVHLERPIDIVDPCRVYRCDRDAGILTEPVDDGVACGPTSCRSARICLSGRCETRTTPNADDECAYTAVCTWGVPGFDYGCATTRARTMRCWGSPAALGRDGGSKPARFPGAIDAVAPVCGVGSPGWLDGTGAMRPSNPFAALGLQRLVGTEGLGTVNQLGVPALLAVDERGSLAYVSSVGSGVLVDAGVIRSCGWNAALRDGGVVARNADGSVFRVDALDCAAGGSAVVTLLFDGGLVPAGSATPVVSIGSDRGGVSFASGPTVSRRTGGVWEELGEWPGGAPQLSRGFGSLCGISDGGFLACWAAPPGSMLDRVPDEPVLFGRDVSYVSVGSRKTAAVQGRQAVLAWVGFPNRYDAGDPTVQPAIALANVSVERFDGDCALAGTRRWCLLADGGTRERGDMASLHVTLSGELLDVEDRVVRRDALPGSSFSGVLQRDGGLLTPSGAVLAAPQVGTEQQASNFCAVSERSVWCWDPVTAPVRVLTRAGLRLAAGSVQSGCAVFDANGIECWGFQRPTLRRVISPGRVVQISVDSYSVVGPAACALADDGTARCWGDNLEGRLGVAPWDGRGIFPFVE
jgi:hypothetical protein